METSRVTPVIIALAVVLLLIGGYAGSYYAMVKNGGQVLVGEPRLVILPTYRWGGAPIATFFYPVHQLDRQLRPQRWGPQIDIQVR